jgi:hypothetical protein
MNRIGAAHSAISRESVGAMIGLLRMPARRSAWVELGMELASGYPLVPVMLVVVIVFFGADY